MDLEIRASKGKGRGVFACKSFEEEEIVEVCPMIVLPHKDWKKIHTTDLYDYYYYLNDPGRTDKVGIVLGYGMLYNHSTEPNVECDYDLVEKTMTFCALRAIVVGEELMINYNCDPTAKDKIDFRPYRKWRGY